MSVEHNLVCRHMVGRDKIMVHSISKHTSLVESPFNKVDYTNKSGDPQTWVAYMQDDFKCIRNRGAAVNGLPHVLQRWCQSQLPVICLIQPSLVVRAVNIWSIFEPQRVLCHATQQITSYSITPSLEKSCQSMRMSANIPLPRAADISCPELLKPPFFDPSPATPSRAATTVAA